MSSVFLPLGFAACMVPSILAWLPALNAPMAGEEQTHDAAEAEFSSVRDAYLAKFRPLYTESERASWEASITGSDVAFARQRAAQEALIDLHSDRAAFAKLKTLKEDGAVTDPVSRRELDVMYRA